MANPPRIYETSLDRAGYALAAGGALIGVLAAVLVAIGGALSFAAIAAALLFGTLGGALAIAAVGGPLWLVLHWLGRRGPVSAALLGAACAFVLFLRAQTFGFGLAEAPPTDPATLHYRWLSALATSALVAPIAAALGWAMWRVAYRRIT